MHESNKIGGGELSSRKKDRAQILNAVCALYHPPSATRRKRPLFVGLGWVELTVYSAVAVADLHSGYGGYLFGNGLAVNTR